MNHSRGPRAINYRRHREGAGPSAGDGPGGAIAPSRTVARRRPQGVRVVLLLAERRDGIMVGPPPLT
ncbi:hypothetical protein FAGKG844_410016 [Frankia sp. AgKG'84/4]